MAFYKIRKFFFEIFRDFLCAGFSDIKWRFKTLPGYPDFLEEIPRGITRLSGGGPWQSSSVVGGRPLTCHHHVGGKGTRHVSQPLTGFYIVATFAAHRLLLQH